MSQESNTLRQFMSPTFGDQKLNKDIELNEQMSIVETNSADAFEKANNTLTGGNE